MGRTAEELLEPLKTAVERWDALEWPRPAAAVVSGSGLAVALGEPVRGPIDLEHFLPFPVHAVEGHPHQAELLVPLPGRTVLYQRGRLHSYQGYDAHETVFPVRLAALLGVKVLILTNAAGGLQLDQRAGDLVLIRDHLNLTGLNPLRGTLPPDWGPRFPDLTAAYDAHLGGLARRLAAELEIPLADGVYAGLAGPSYETPAEVRMLRALGGDVTGMSTVLEVIAARHMGLRCLGLSVVSNPAAGISPLPIAHADVLAAGQAAGGRLQRLLLALLASPELL
ncbi:MAG TPA: purine-nucleoside phosphorylase [Thermoanaerobaculia bacterium]|nr:purine-nucleoside phosphorylase [Thermoanaerobaculia bacterium]